MQATIDFLLGELNEIANKASAESLRITTMFDVREVFRRIGLIETAQIVEQEVEIVNHIYKVPDKFIAIDDVGRRRGEWEGLAVRSGAKYKDPLVYIKDVRGLYFPNISSGKIWIKAYQFQVDEKGQPLIPEEAYAACYDYCRYKIISNMPTSPHWQDRRIAKFDSEASIRIARGHFNEVNNSVLREIRK